MTNAHTPDGDTRALVIANMALGYAVAVMLRRVGVLGSTDLDEAFDAALSSLAEALPPDKAPSAIACQLLDLMAAKMAVSESPIAYCSPLDNVEIRDRASTQHAGEPPI